VHDIELQLREALDAARLNLVKVLEAERKVDSNLLSESRNGIEFVRKIQGLKHLKEQRLLDAHEEARFVRLLQAHP